MKISCYNSLPNIKKQSCWKREIIESGDSKTILARKGGHSKFLPWSAYGLTLLHFWSQACEAVPIKSS